MGKKIFKIVGYSLGVFFLLLFILVGVIFYHLPSAQEIGNFFKKEIPPINQPQIKNQNSAVGSASDVTNEQATEEHNNSDVNQERKIINKNLSTAELKKFLDKDTPVSDFCDKLSFARSGPMKVFSVQNDQEAKKLSDEDMSDLRIDAIMPLAKMILKKPEMQKLTAMILQSENLNEEQKQELASQGILDKAHFYAQIYSTYVELKNNLKEYESVVDRTYLFYKLNDLIALKPDLQNDERVQKFCDENEYLFNSYTPVEFDHEKASFERLISELGVSQEQIKYDPNYKTSLDIKFSANSLQMSGGWLNEVVPTKK